MPRCVVTHRDNRFLYSICTDLNHACCYKCSNWMIIKFEFWLSVHMLNMLEIAFFILKKRSIVLPLSVDSMDLFSKVGLERTKFSFGHGLYCNTACTITKFCSSDNIFKRSNFAFHTLIYILCWPPFNYISYFLKGNVATC